jgi:hypothetical protein
MFQAQNVRHYVILFAVVAIASYFGNQLRTTYDNQEKAEEFDLIRKYLLNDGPLENYHKPKLWIHTKYAVNARKWKSFYSRNTTDLNQPYIHLTIKTIIQHCGDDFNICLIDDESFSKLLPSWSIKMATLPEPFKARARSLGLAMLLHHYGGMAVPNSFICTKNLMGLYEEGITGQVPFVTERVNRLVNFERHHLKMLFVPDTYFMGCRRGDPIMGELVSFLHGPATDYHFQDEATFLGSTARWLMTKVDTRQMNMVSGEKVGVKTTDRKTILLEDLMEAAPLKLDPTAYGIYIPEEDVLTRNKYQWFAVMPAEQLLGTDMIVVKYLNEALEYTTPSSKVIYEDVAMRKQLDSLSY